MAVKSATKRRLIQEGMDEASAHLLADDRNMDKIRSMSLDEIAAALSVKKDSELVKSVMDVIRALGAGRRKRAPVERISVSEVAAENLTRFNPLNHQLVPHHELLPVEREQEELSPWDMVVDDGNGNIKIRRELLPKILITDPIVQVIKEHAESEDPELLAGWMHNRILKIVRRSPSSGISTAYRLIVEGG